MFTSSTPPQSVIGYWQQNVTALDAERTDESGMLTLADYIDHLDDCVRNPTALQDINMDQPCLARYGGPVMPWVALGGFPGDNYENATALVVTYNLYNYDSKEFQKNATAWEAEFLKLMDSYESENITIAHSAEVRVFIMCAICGNSTFCTCI